MVDSLLVLLGKYSCHLKRGNQSMADFLALDFKNYISDLEKATSYEANPLIQKEMCELVKDHISEIKKNAGKIVQVFSLYTEGKIVSASNKAFEVFEAMKSQLMQRYSGAFHKNCYYRIRSVKENGIPLERKGLFHIPRTQNYLVGTERYSMPGHPCLYLASQSQLAWYECGKPKRFYISKFDIPQEENDHLTFVDFSEKLMPLMHSFVSWFHNEDDKDKVRRYLLKYLYTYPLRAACSIVVKHPKGKFKEEYIIPQLLLQWVVNDTDFDGISYESCKDSDFVKGLGGHNLVLVTKEFDEEGYDKKLRKCVRVGEPTYFDITKIKVAPELEAHMKDRDIENEPFYWGMEKISDDYRNI